MFSYIFATNSVTDEIDRSLKVISKTKNKNDKIILINYNQYHIEYREGDFDIDYRHIKTSRIDAINSVLPECGNVVVFAIGVSVTKTFVREISKFYDRHSFQTIRVDKSSKSGKYIESDFRIGSMITPSSFTGSSIAFNTSVVSKLSDNISETAKHLMNSGVSLRLLQNVKTLKTDKVTTKKAIVGISVIIPSRSHKLSGRIKESLMSNDRVVEFEENPRTVRNVICKSALQSVNDCVLLISPHSNLFDSSIINRIRSMYLNNENILFDNSSNNDVSSNAWLVTNKMNLSSLPKSLTTTPSIINYVVSSQPDIMRYSEVSESPTDEIKSGMSNNSISIIIPFKYDGDRWPLFEASIKNLYNKVNAYDNIEIVVHEASTKRHISPEFVKKYNLVHLFSEYKGTFHKSWVMNVACKYIARGDTFVFFDADMIVDHGWVIELLNCDKTKCLYGWGRIFNLNKEATKQYVADGTLSGGVIKVSKPNIVTSAGGITLMPRNEFFKAGGWLESYKGLGYGGQDNSMAYKLTSLELYSKVFKDFAFVSSIWHLYHGHQIIKKPKRLKVHEEHSKYTSQDWYRYLEENHVWGVPLDNINAEAFDTYLNKGLVNALTKLNDIKITVCVVSNGKIDRLYGILKTLADTKVSMNVMLWVNNFKGVQPSVKQNLQTICKAFKNHRIHYSLDDKGVGYPQFMLTNQAVFEYSTPYVMILDDTAIIDTAEAMVLGASVLRQDKYSKYGAVGIASMNTDDDITHGLKDADFLHPLAMTIRHDLLKEVIVDPNYTSNMVGWDLCKQIGEMGYKIGLIDDPIYNIPKNILRADIETPDVDRFKKKWGIDVTDIYHIDNPTIK